MCQRINYSKANFQCGVPGSSPQSRPWRWRVCDAVRWVWICLTFSAPRIEPASVCALAPLTWIEERCCIFGVFPLVTASRRFGGKSEVKLLGRAKTGKTTTVVLRTGIPGFVVGRSVGPREVDWFIGSDWWGSREERRAFGGLVAVECNLSHCYGALECATICTEEVLIGNLDLDRFSRGKTNEWFVELGELPASPWRLAVWPFRSARSTRGTFSPRTASPARRSADRWRLSALSSFADRCHHLRRPHSVVPTIRGTCGCSFSLPPSVRPKVELASGGRAAHLTRTNPSSSAGTRSIRISPSPHPSSGPALGSLIEPILGWFLPNKKKQQLYNKNHFP